MRALDPQPTRLTTIAGLRSRASLFATGLGLILVVALTSRSAPLIFPSGAGLSPLDVVEIVGYVALFVGLVLVPVTIWFGRHRRRDLAAPVAERRSLSSFPRWASALGLLVVILIMTGQGAVIIAYLAGLQRPGREPLDDGQGAGAPIDPSLTAAPGTETLAIALVITAVIAVVAVIALITWSRETGPADREERITEPEARVEAVDVGLDALRSEPDPRRAVIAAYAAMARSLSRSGLPRDVSEAPLEYLRRVFKGLAGVPQDVATITQLFLVAKFSHHEVDESMRTAAVGALERLRARTEPGQ